MDTKKALKELGLKLIQLESKDDDAIPGQAELLSSLEAEQSVLKDEIAKELDRIQNDKSKVKSSSKSSISSLTSFAKKFSSKSVSDIDPLTLINENRERIQELQGLISDATYPRIQEEARARRAAEKEREIHLIYHEAFESGSYSDSSPLELEQKLKRHFDKACSDIHEAEMGIKSYSEALPLLQQAKKALDEVSASTLDLSASTRHLQKLNESSIESSALIADTSISAAWSHLLAADPDLDFDTPTLPELPEDITGWVLQVRPLLKELLRESELAIQRNEQKILSLSYKKMDLELKLHNEQRRVLIDAAHDRWEMEPPEYTPANEETSKDSWKPFQNLSLGRNMHSNNLIQYNQVKVVDTVSAARNEWDSEPEPVIIPVPSSALPAFEQTAEPPKYSTETSSNTISLFGNEWGGFNVPASTVGQEREPSQTSSTDPPAIPPRRTPSVKQDTVTVNSDPWGNTQPAYTHSPQLPPRKLTSRLKSSERLSDVSHASPSSTYVTVNPYAAGKESAELFTPRIVRNVSFEEPSPAGRSEPTQPIYTQEWPTTTYEPFFKQEDVQPEIEQEPEPFPLKTSLYALQDNPWS